MTIFYGLRSDSSGCPPTPPPRPCCSSAITSMLLLLHYSSVKAPRNEGLMSLRQSKCVREDEVDDKWSLDSTSAGTRRAHARALPAHLARRLLAVRWSSLSFFLSLSVLSNAWSLQRRFAFSMLEMRNCSKKIEKSSGSWPGGWLCDGTLKTQTRVSWPKWLFLPIVTFLRMFRFVFLWKRSEGFFFSHQNTKIVLTARWPRQEIPFVTDQ